jgi:hypothetical protein
MEKSKFAERMCQEAEEEDRIKDENTNSEYRHWSWDSVIRPIHEYDMAT